MILRIASVLSRSGKGAEVLLDPNPFRPSGGGQPADRGRLEAEDFEAAVVDVRLVDGLAVTELRIGRGEPREGSAVRALPDEAWRSLLTRMHSGEHILSKVLEGLCQGLHVTKTHIGDKESSVTIAYDGEIGWELLFEAEKRARDVIAENRTVTVHELSAEEARAFPGLKANWERIGDDVVRVVEIDGFDANACCGSHVASTAEVGDLFVTAYNGSAPDWTVTFTVEGSLRDLYGQVMRRLLRGVGCPVDRIEGVYEKLRAEKEGLARDLDRARQNLSLSWTTEECGAFRLHFVELPGWTADLVSPAVKKQVESDGRALVVVLCPGPEGRGPFVVARGSDVSFDLRAFLKGHPELGARGGGASAWVSGVATAPWPLWRRALGL